MNIEAIFAAAEERKAAREAGLRTADPDPDALAYARHFVTQGEGGHTLKTFAMALEGKGLLLMNSPHD